MFTESDVLERSYTKLLSEAYPVSFEIFPKAKGDTTEDTYIPSPLELYGYYEDLLEKVKKAEKGELPHEKEGKDKLLHLMILLQQIQEDTNRVYSERPSEGFPDYLVPPFNLLVAYLERMDWKKALEGLYNAHALLEFSKLDAVRLSGSLDKDSFKECSDKLERVLSFWEDSETLEDLERAQELISEAKEDLFRALTINSENPEEDPLWSFQRLVRTEQELKRGRLAPSKWGIVTNRSNNLGIGGLKGAANYMNPEAYILSLGHNNPKYFNENRLDLLASHSLTIGEIYRKLNKYEGIVEEYAEGIRAGTVERDLYRREDAKGMSLSEIVNENLRLVENKPFSEQNKTRYLRLSMAALDWLSRDLPKDLKKHFLED